MCLGFLINHTIAQGQTAKYLPQNQPELEPLQQIHSSKLINPTQLNLEALLLHSEKLYYHTDTFYNFNIPFNDKINITFKICNSQTLSAPFQSSFKNIYTYKGQSIDKQYVIRLIIAPNNFWASITQLSDASEWIIPPRPIRLTRLIFFTKIMMI